MSKNNEFDNILDECLERLINGVAIEVCLEDYPQQAAELEPLLQTVMDARKAAAIRPRPEFRDRANYKFQAAIRDMEPVKDRGFFGRFPRWATVVTSVVIVILLAATGTALASTSSLPDEPLYQVKLATEGLRLAFTPSELGKAELYAEFADERVAEIVRMADEGNVEQVEKATERMNDQLIAMSSLIAPGEQGDAKMQVATFEAAEAPLESVPAPSPAPAPAPAAAPEPREAPAPVVEAPPVVPEKQPLLTAPRAPGVSDATAEGGEPAWAGEPAEPGSQAQLRIDVFNQARENIRELETLLETAPESLKPSLQRALEVAHNGYEAVLRGLE
jgi:hypothetical protein